MAQATIPSSHTSLAPLSFEPYREFSSVELRQRIRSVKRQLGDWLLILGHHEMSKPEHVEQFRRRFPDGRVLVHPECMMSVVDQADEVGSTEFIINTIAGAQAGSTWGVGTELHLVNRLAQEYPDKQVFFRSPMVCMSATMFRIDLPHLSWCFDNLARGTHVNRIRVSQDTAHWARLALRRMLEIN
jgi:quinolinate synthase